MSAPEQPLEHYVSEEPFDPYSIEALSPEQERYYLASQWQMMWWRLRRHKLAVWSGMILALMYLSTVFTEVLAPLIWSTGAAPLNNEQLIFYIDDLVWE